MANVPFNLVTVPRRPPDLWIVLRILQIAVFGSADFGL